MTIKPLDLGVKRKPSQVVARLKTIAKSSEALTPLFVELYRDYHNKSIQGCAFEVNRFGTQTTLAWNFVFKRNTASNAFAQNAKAVSMVNDQVQKVANKYADKVETLSLMTEEMAVATDIFATENGANAFTEHETSFGSKLVLNDDGSALMSNDRRN